MKNVKLSFALIIAVLAAGITVATKANFTGKRLITACYSTLTVTSQVTGGDAEPLQALNCQDARDLVGTVAVPGPKPFVFSASSIISNPEDVCQDEVEFCCAQFDFTSDPDAPTINLNNGDGPRKYQVVAVFCRE